MAITPLALMHGLSREQIELAVTEAATTVAIDNVPTRIMILAFGEAGQLLEATAVIRDEDLLFVHAGPAHAGYEALLDTTSPSPSEAKASAAAAGTGSDFSVDGVELTPSRVAELIRRAETGHDLETLKVRLRPGRPAPLSVGDVVRLELNPALHAACAVRADSEGVPVQEVVRQALRAHLHAVTPE
jgi:hypothetical protein